MKNELLSILHEEGYAVGKNNSKITLEDLIEGYLSGNVNEYVRDKRKCSKDAVTRCIRNTFPSKPVGNSSTVQWILGLWELRYCSSCNNIFSTEDFYSNTSDPSGYSTYCKGCSKEYRKDSYRQDPSKEKAANLARRADVHQRTPAWADLQIIALFYKNRPEGYHVDHIVPLHGTLVTGLHVIENLQYLPAKENLAKKNKFIP